MKIILNKCFGGFSLSKKAYELYANKIGKKVYAYVNEDFRDNIYKKVNGDSLFVTYFTKDFGEEEKYRKPHFDIAQKQILIWEDLNDLRKKLSEWIKAIVG